MLVNFNNKKGIFCGSILTPNTRSLTIMILHLKPKVVIVLEKTWFIRTNLQQQYSISSLIFPLYIFAFRNASKMPSLTFFANIWCYWLKQNEFSNLLKSYSHLPKKFVLFASLKRPLKLMKNAFYFILKAYFVLKIFKFLS